MLIPSSCSQKAFEFFEDQFDVIDSNQGMVNASLAIAMHSFEDLDCREVWQKINQLSAKIASRSGGQNIEARIAHLHQILFIEEGFVALPKRQASHLLDSFLSMVLELKVGTPELIGLIYKVVAEMNGIVAEPVLYRDRLHLRVYDGHGWLLLDMCNRGQLVDPDGRDVIKLNSLSHREWIGRMLFRNMSLLENSGRHQDHAAMEELHSVLQSIQA